MISAAIASEILRLTEAEHWPVGTIASQLGVHHSVVTRVLRQHAMGRSFVSIRPSMIEPYIDFIKEKLEQYPKLCASRLYEMVRERGYSGGPDHFRAQVAKYRPKRVAEAFLRLRTLPGEQAQVDWGDFGKRSVDGAERRLYAFVMTLSHSRALFVKFSYSASMGAFLQGHVEAFESFGGVPRTVLYDNLKSAVLSRVGDAIQFHPKFLAMAQHYKYLPKPVAVARGNEKGRVERSIRYLRTGFFAAREFTDLEHLNRLVREWIVNIADKRPCPEDRSRKVFEVRDKDCSLLLPLPDDPYPAEDIVTVSAGKTPYIRFDSNDYSIPFRRVRRQLTVLASEYRVTIADGSEIIASHDRCWGKGKQIENPDHIEELVNAKRSARRDRSMDRLHSSCPSCQRFLQVVAQRGGNLGSTTVALEKLLSRYGAEKLEAAVEEAIRQETQHLSAVRYLLDQQQQRQNLPPPAELHLSTQARALSTPVNPHSLSTYDQLLKDQDDDIF